ncbi:ATP-binding cassette domain-containing protein [Euzebyella saccharophila]|uniref:ATP-binding cassette domain-containing protein n=1 Tax=Euzebyella saccharophila TaxID=679664 RepID=A0ABV8JMD7_9FLAO|nr:ATP-binding cassette domain-containing protein [Euzebyella saccharophila]
MNILHIDSLTKSYGDKIILSDIFLSCGIGQIKGLIGRNGSGKSTLLKIVFGTESANTKFIRVGEKIVRNVTDGRGLINYLPQDHFLPNNVKIKTIINLFLDKENREVLFANEHLKPLLNKKNQELSGGERRIIEILLIIHSNAQFVLLDEPFNGVSPIIRDYIIEYIKKRKSSKGFIITDHDFENVIGLADKIIFLDNGYLRELKDKKELVELGYIKKTTYNTGNRCASP